MDTDQAGQQVNDIGTAGVIARPPLLFLGALLVGFVLDWLLPLPLAMPGGGPLRWAVGGALAVIGVAFFVAGIGGFKRAGTPVPTNQPTRALVTSGVHARTRNPIYLGMFLLYAGIGVAAGGLWILILIVPLAIVIRYGVIAREEAYLEWRFGEAYVGYRARVRRWL
jgi:protein-S-isoprenylcysteine O-methyltransferase Ste14